MLLCCCCVFLIILPVLSGARLLYYRATLWPIGTLQRREATASPEVLASSGSAEPSIGNWQRGQTCEGGGRGEGERRTRC